MVLVSGCYGTCFWLFQYMFLVVTVLLVATILISGCFSNFFRGVTVLATGCHGTLFWLCLVFVVTVLFSGYYSCYSTSLWL
jgi:hypothetical protein